MAVPPRYMHTYWAMARVLWAVSWVNGGAGCLESRDGLNNLWLLPKALLSGGPSFFLFLCVVSILF